MLRKFTDHLSALVLVAATGALTIAPTSAEAQQRVRASGSNGTVVTNQGPNGGASVRSRGVRRNADGSVTAGSAGAIRGPNGARAARDSTTTVNPDGSARRQSSASASGSNGSATTTSDVTRNADGTYSGGRTTTATSTTTGTTYNGQVQIDPATGQPVRTATCTDAAGNTIACPTPN